MLSPVPTRLEPFYSPRLWGAKSLSPYFPNAPHLNEPIGEAWVTSFDSCVANGPFAGKLLKEAWHAMSPAWRGARFASMQEFPVLVKFLFPNDKLSIQVHPDDHYAALHEQAKGGRGKTEMWHILSATKGAEILFGLKTGVQRDIFLRALAENRVEELLEHVPVSAGETYFVSPGTQHAIGPGVVICEVQEYSDLTYRVYDFGRVDAAGKQRELHVEKALAVTNFSGNRSSKLAPLALHSPDAKKRLLAACKYFAAERWEVHKTTLIESDSEEFQIFVFLEGTGCFYDANCDFPFHPGEAWFLPANLPTILMHPHGHASALRVTVPDVQRLRCQLRNQGFEDQAISRIVAS